MNEGSLLVKNRQNCDFFRPRHVFGRSSDVIASQSRNRNKRDVVEVEGFKTTSQLVDNPIEDGLVETDGVHLVDGHDDVLDTHE